MKKISIIIPCYNEIKTIEEILNRVNKFNNLEKEIIIIDDNSSDGTRDFLIKRKNNYKFEHEKIIFNKKNYGKGYCLREGIAASTGDIILFQDADLEYNPNEYPRLLRPILDNQADVVYGSRFLGSGDRRVLYFWHRVGNYLLTLLSNMLSNINLTDMEIGYKVFKSEYLKNLNLVENRFGIEPEITAKIAKKKLKIYEVGVSYYGRTYKEGKKINWKDGFSAIRCIFKYNLF